MALTQLQKDHTVVKELYSNDYINNVLHARYTLKNGMILSVQEHCDTDMEDTKDKLRAAAQVMINGFLGLDSTTLKQPNDPSRLAQIKTFTQELQDMEERIHNLQNSIKTDEFAGYTDDEKHDIVEQINHLSCYAMVLRRRINRMKL